MRRCLIYDDDIERILKALGYLNKSVYLFIKRVTGGAGLVCLLLLGREKL